MALFKQKIEAGQVIDINKEGRFIKVINCQSELHIRVFGLKGELVLDTPVRGGFDIKLQGFARITIQASESQQYEIWADENALGYDALTKGSNTNQSGIIEHFGGSQRVLPFESNRVAVTLFSDSEPFWYGGQGVNVENGIPVAAGVPHKIEGAGELHIAIDIPPVYDPIVSSEQQKSAAWSAYGMNSHSMTVDNATGDVYLSSSNTGDTLYKINKQGVSSLNVGGRAAKAMNGFVYAMQLENASGGDVKRINVVDRYGNLTVNPLHMPQAGGRPEQFSHDGEKQFLSFYGAPSGFMVGDVECMESTNYCSSFYVTNEGEFFGLIDGRKVHITDGVYPALAADAPALAIDNSPSGFYCLGENNNFVVFSVSSYGTPKIYVKKDGVFVNAAHSGNNTTAGSDGYLYSHYGTKIYRSEDAVNWVEIADGMHESVNSHRLFVGAGFMLSVNPQSYSFKYYSAEISTEKAQAKIRMLKEVV
jgi:hypothetical protein